MVLLAPERRLNSRPKTFKVQCETFVRRQCDSERTASQRSIVITSGVVAIVLTVACIGGCGEASAQEQCLVAGPTGTPLNVRAAPNGQIVETLSDGTVVTILDRSSANGRAWVYVRRNKDQAPLGWVFRDLLRLAKQLFPRPILEQMLYLEPRSSIAPRLPSGPANCIEAKGQIELNRTELARAPALRNGKRLGL